MQHPYPHPCAECGQITVDRAMIGYDASVKYDGKLHVFHIANLNIDKCSACGEQYFTALTEDQISHALRTHIGLLHPDDIKRRLNELGLTQRQFAEQLRLAQETVSRWLTGGGIQSRSLDTLMRIYFQFPEVRKELESAEVFGGLGVENSPASGAVALVEHS